MKLIKCRKCGRYFRVTDDDYCLSKCTGCGSTDLEETIYKLDGSNIDWEERRADFAKSAMNAILANREMVADMLQSPNPKGFEYQVARKSVSFADALIAELKKKGE